VQEIAKYYIFKGSFVIDVLATFPWDVLSDFIPPESSDTFTLVMFVKATRLLRLGRLLKKLNEIPFANTVKLLKLLFLYLLIAHWTGCIFYFIGRYQQDSLNDAGKKPWIQTFDISSTAISIRTKWIT
jgi:hypothetical protein